MDTTTAYHQTRQRMSDLFRGLDAEQAKTIVNCCPDWTVTDLAAHVTGVAADLVAGRLEGVGTDPWTDVQVESRRGRDLGEIVDEWDRVGNALEGSATDGGLPEQLVFDTVTHEHDLRQAIGDPGAQEDEAITVALSFVMQFWPLVTATTDVPPLRVVFGSQEMKVGNDPEHTLTLTPFETLRGFTGRRSLDQIRAWAWPADPSPWLSSFTWGPLTPAANDIDET